MSIIFKLAAVIHISTELFTRLGDFEQTWNSSHYFYVIE